MNLYVESSALLRWLLQDADGSAIGAALQQAEAIFCSRLTLLESRRTVQRLKAGYPDAVAELLALLADSTLGWNVLDLIEPILARADEAFPVEPVRSLDAIHLATALFLRDATADLTMLTTDARVRKNAEALGIPVLP